MIIIFAISAFIIFWAMVGYPVFLKILDSIMKRQNTKDGTFLPTVTVMVVAHNEEKVIYDKLTNLLTLEYPAHLLSILVASDNSGDKTNSIVEEFIRSNPGHRITLYKAKERKGKTNAQNEAQKLVKSDILVMTDANSMLKANSINEIVSSFSHPDIAYVSGKLILTNKDIDQVGNLEGTYWDLDLEMRRIESNIQTITAGNGALYACRNAEYVDFDPIESHDSAMPIYYALAKKRALYNPDAIAFEKSGDSFKEEYSRKVRMNRNMIKRTLPDLRILNILKYKWFTVFYLGHRTSRYLLWLSHILLLISSIVLIPCSYIFLGITIFQLIAILVAVLFTYKQSNNRLAKMLSYYLMTVVAQVHGVYNIVSGKAKPFWETAESTRN